MAKEMMKVVVINASPRRGGLISQMLGRIVAALPPECRVDVLTVCDLQVKPCTGCMQCRSLGRCVLPEDDAHCVAELIRACDALIVGSPCYWGAMPGQTKALFDRMVYALMGERPNGMPLPLHRGKPAVVVATSNTAWPFNVWFHQTSGVIRSLKEIFRWSGFRLAGTLQKGGCRKRGALTPREIAKCKKLARKIC